MAIKFNNSVLSTLDGLTSSERTTVFNGVDAIGRETALTKDSLQKVKRFKLLTNFTIVYWYERSGADIRIIKVSRNRSNAEEANTTSYANVKNRYNS